MPTVHIVRYARDNGEQITVETRKTSLIARTLLLAGYVLGKCDGVTVEDKRGKRLLVTKGKNIHLAQTRRIRVVAPVTPRVLVADDTEYDFYSHNDLLALCRRFGRPGNVVVEAEGQIFAVSDETWAPTRFRRLVLLTPRQPPPPPPPTAVSLFRTAKILEIPLRGGGIKEEQFFKRHELERLLVDHGFPINRIGTTVTYTTPSGEEITDRYVSSNTNIPMSLVRIRVTQPFFT